MSELNELSMFGDLEDGPEGNGMIVRVAGHRLGIADGWFHWAGLAVVFPAFRAEAESLKKEMPRDANPDDIHLGIDCYTGEVLILIKSKSEIESPKVHKRLQLLDILKEV